MAGDFVIVQCATPRKPEVLRIAQLLNVPPPHAFGLCIQAWIWFDEQTEDGHAVGVTSVTLDSIVCHAGFTQALMDVGWLHAREGALQVPNFDQHMGQSAKKRAKDNKRQQKHRHASVTKRRDKNVTKEEKRREEKSNKETPLPPSLQTEEFQAAWKAWHAHRTELKKPLRPTMESEQLAMLEGLGVKRAVAMVRYTIAMGWQGLREEEPSNGKLRHPQRVAANIAENL